MTWVALIGTVVTVIVGPLLAWWLKNWIEQQAKDAATEARQKGEEQTARTEIVKAGDATRDVNASIDAQKAAREKWAKDNP